MKREVMQFTIHGYARVSPEGWDTSPLTKPFLGISTVKLIEVASITNGVGSWQQSMRKRAVVPLSDWGYSVIEGIKLYMQGTDLVLLPPYPK